MSYSKIANLHKSRQGHSSIICETKIPASGDNPSRVLKYLYVFGGYSDSHNSNIQSIERLNITDPDCNWELITLNNLSSEVLLTNCLVIPPLEKTQGNTEFILLGGRMGLEDNPQDCTLKVTIEESAAEGTSPIAIIEKSDYWMQEEESFNNRICMPNSYCEKGKIFVIGDSGSCFMIQKKYDEDLTEQQLNKTQLLNTHWLDDIYQ